jgi:hypothetical protein
MTMRLVRVLVALMSCVALTHGAVNDAREEKHSDDPKASHSPAHAAIVQHASVAKASKTAVTRSREIANARSIKATQDAGRQNTRADQANAGRNIAAHSAQAGHPPVKVASAPPFALSVPRAATRRSPALAMVGGPASTRKGVIDGAGTSIARRR